MTDTQSAVLVRAYGGASAAEIGEIAKPSAEEGKVLVRARSGLERYRLEAQRRTRPEGFLHAAAGRASN